jgi:hypothetical protein
LGVKSGSSIPGRPAREKYAELGAEAIDAMRAVKAASIREYIQSHKNPARKNPAGGPGLSS